MAGRFIDEIRAELDYSARGSALPLRIFSAAAHFDAETLFIRGIRSPRVRMAGSTPVFVRVSMHVSMMAGDEERDHDVSRCRNKINYSVSII